MANHQIEIKSGSIALTLSQHLFWDIDRASLDFTVHKKFVVQRVLEYGLLSDWLTITRYYGKDEIGKIGLTLRRLDRRALAFLSAYTGIPKDEFLCYTTKPLTHPHWPC